MARILKFIILFSLLSLIGCQSAMVRAPGSIQASYQKEDLKGLKLRKVELSAMSIHFHKKRNEEQLAKIQEEQKNIEQKIQEIELHEVL